MPDETYPLNYIIFRYCLQSEIIKILQHSSVGRRDGPSVIAGSASLVIIPIGTRDLLILEYCVNS